MTDADAATLVGAGVVSVMLFPQIAAAIGRRSNAQAQPADADDVAPAWSGGQSLIEGGHGQRSVHLRGDPNPAAGARPAVRCTGSSRDPGN